MIIRFLRKWLLKKGVGELLMEALLIGFVLDLLAIVNPPQIIERIKEVIQWL